MSKTRIVMLLSIFCLTAQLVADDGIIIRKNQRTLGQIEHIYSEMLPVVTVQLGQPFFASDPLEITKVVQQVRTALKQLGVDLRP